MGVRRAMEMVLSEANKQKGPVYTFGPLIHNKQVLELLESKQVIEVNDPKGIDDGPLVIRAHGIPPDQRKIIKSSKLRLIDATCPRVARVQAIIRYHTNKGYDSVIVGDKGHAEVIGLVGYGNGRAFVINSISEIFNLPETEKIIVVAQTTQNEKKYSAIVKAIKSRFPKALIFETICDATRNRQEEIRSFAGHIDGMVVVGGYHSGNTQRLARVSSDSGIPTFHVETEKDLEKERLSSMEVIGITAGASTPNWMIKNVLKEIESIRSRKETLSGQRIKLASKVLLLSNLGVATGAFSLAYAAGILSGRIPGLAYPLLAFLYIYAMHVLNRFLDKGASTYNDPERANFYGKHRFLLILSGIFSIAGALAISWHLGVVIFIAMCGLSLLGISYGITIVPERLRHLWRYSKIKDIPGSKTISEALAWGAVITLIPMLGTSGINWFASLIAFIFVFSVVYVRSALFDIFQVQGDLIVGMETLPITLGEKRTLFLLKGIILSSAIVLMIAPSVGLVENFSYLLLLCYLSLSLSILTYEKRWLYTGNRLEVIVEGNLFLAGILGFIWHIVI